MSDSPTDPILLTIDDVQQMLGVARSSVYRALGTGSLRAVHVGRAIRIPTDSLRAYVAALPAARIRTGRRGGHHDAAA